MIFASRPEAGRRLGKYLQERGVTADLVLGLPRGGVVVAAAVADILKLPLDVLVVRKIGHPWQREFAIGAMAEPESIILDQETLAGSPISKSKLERIIAEETDRLGDYRRRFHLRKLPALAGKTVLLVDDGLATGATAEAAAISARKQGAGRIVIAAPVASTNAADRLRRTADAVEVLAEEHDFEAVGQFYEKFFQTEDQEVISLLQEAARRQGLAA